MDLDRRERFSAEWLARRRSEGALDSASSDDNAASRRAAGQQVHQTRPEGQVTPDALAAAVAASPARLGRTRLVCIDGRAGSGKTTLAAKLAAAYDGSAAILHLEDLYEGWVGLPTVADRVRDEVLPSLAAGRPASVRRWDWIAGRLGAPLTVPVADALILEGVGSYSRSYDEYVSLVVWVDAPDNVRKTRALDRDGDVFAPHWDRWAADEERVLSREGTRDRADLVVGV